MSDKVFFDTNLWIYLYSEDAKAVVVEALLAEQFDRITISTQVLGECFVVLTRKKNKNIRASRADYLRFDGQLYARRNYCGLHRTSATYTQNIPFFLL